MPFEYTTFHFTYGTVSVENKVVDDDIGRGNNFFLSMHNYAYMIAFLLVTNLNSCTTFLDPQKFIYIVNWS